MHVTIARVHDQLFNGDAASVTVPTTEGEVTILPNHEPVVATIAPGTIVVRVGTDTKEFAVEQGVVEVTQSQVSVLL